MGDGEGSADRLLERPKAALASAAVPCSGVGHFPLGDLVSTVPDPFVANQPQCSSNGILASCWGPVVDVHGSTEPARGWSVALESVGGRDMAPGWLQSKHCGVSQMYPNTVTAGTSCATCSSSCSSWLYP